MIRSKIIITQDFQESIKELEAECAKEGVELISIIKDGDFLVSDTKLAIEKAYLTSNRRQVILLGGNHFSEIVQNRLLKILEEPPPNKDFILLFKSRAEILPTIRSRLPIIKQDRNSHKSIEILDLDKLSIDSVYKFIKQYERLSATEAKGIIEALAKEAIANKSYNLDESSLNLFHNAILVLERGSMPQFVLSGVLLKLLAKKRKKGS